MKITVCCMHCKVNIIIQDHANYCRYQTTLQYSSWKCGSDQNCQRTINNDGITANRLILINVYQLSVVINSGCPSINIHGSHRNLQMYMSLGVICLLIDFKMVLITYCKHQNVNCTLSGGYCTGTWPRYLLWKGFGCPNRCCRQLLRNARHMERDLPARDG